MDIELLTKYNHKNIQDRQTDTLIGLSKGLLADGSINQKEAEYFPNWVFANNIILKPLIYINIISPRSSGR